MKRITLFTLLALIPLIGSAANLRLAVQPMMDDTCYAARYEALRSYLEQQTGYQIELIRESNVQIFWRNLRASRYDLVLGTSQIIGSRVRSGDLVPILTSNSKRVYQLITLDGTGIESPSELLGERIAGEGAPGMAALAFNEFYPNIVVQPSYRVVDSAENALDLLRRGKVKAVIMPQPQAKCVAGSRVLATSSKVIEPMIAASPALTGAMREAITHALLDVGRHVAGLRALDDARLPGFEPAHEPTWNAAADVLEQAWYY